MTILVKNALNKYLSLGGSTPPVEYMTILNGTTSYINVPDIPVEAGETFEVSFLGVSNNSGQTWVIVSGTNPIVTTRCTIELTAANKIKYFASTYSQVLLDGVPVVNDITDAPIDGEIHTLTCTVAVRTDIGSLGVFWNEAVLFANTAVTGLKKEDGSTYNYLFNEPWIEHPIAVNTAYTLGSNEWPSNATTIIDTTVTSNGDGTYTTTGGTLAAGIRLIGVTLPANSKYLLEYTMSEELGVTVGGRIDGNSNQRLVSTRYRGLYDVDSDGTTDIRIFISTGAVSGAIISDISLKRADGYAEYVNTIEADVVPRP